ncbi:anti-sigma factor antagonist [Nonomuraea diastatica]|uniref:Anti-sigma factor antagonist n=1 Tax=Nonomuraea diastatica TaxID=1848329 RepID=A0A4R4WCA5_9ACTN|nr:STAS domain-containing protein [Nonomuraea diastatica]TDD13614.1 anti-sigma factor antagonist [Nonomuraea diastatica]
MRDIDLEVFGPTGDCAAVRVVGEIDVFTAPRMREQVLDLVAKGVVHVVVDLSGVEFLDSTGLGVLVGALKRLRTHEGSLALVMSTDRIVRIFTITGLTAVFPIHDAVPDAIAANAHWVRAVERGGESVEEWCRRHGLA